MEEYFDLGGIFSKTEAELAAKDAELFPFFQAGSENAPAAVSPPPRLLGAWRARAQYFSMGRRHDYSEALAEITAPTLVVHGGNDLQPIEVANDYAAWIPNSSVGDHPGLWAHSPLHPRRRPRLESSGVPGWTCGGRAYALNCWLAGPDSSDLKQAHLESARWRARRHTPATRAHRLRRTLAGQRNPVSKAGTRWQRQPSF